MITTNFSKMSGQKFFNKILMPIPVPLEILQCIFDKLDFKSQIIFKQLCKDFYYNLRIYDFYNIDPKYKSKLKLNTAK